MKIKCEYCGTMINDTLEQCPHCGAPNPRVRRSANGQPLTIAELKKWYEDRGLPPYEITRFFIGIDYKKPRAFGIYFDEKTGNYVVYKNKDSGARAIRYEGTDEAFAVNELLERLKQEIHQQKTSNLNKTKNSAKEKESGWHLPNVLKWLIQIVLGFFGLIAGFFGLIAGFFAILLVLGGIITLTEPKTGYYNYQEAIYYRSDLSYYGDYWYVYEGKDADWSAPISDENVPNPLQKRKTSKPYYIQEKWDTSLPCSDFAQSVYAQDINVGVSIAPGYYQYGDTWYYHLEYCYNENWYVWDGRWSPISADAMPKELLHSSLIKPYVQGPVYFDFYDCGDFEQTLYYQDYVASKKVKKGYYYVDDSVFYHLAEDYDEGWYTYNNEEWQATEDLPEEFSHPSTIEDYYFTPEWDASTQFTDFEDTPLYKADKDNWSDSSSSSSFDWDSGDSWDSDDTDWDSDW